MAREKLSKVHQPQPMGITASQPEKSSTLKKTPTTTFRTPSSSLPDNKSHVDESKTVILNREAAHPFSHEVSASLADGGRNGYEDVKSSGESENSSDEEDDDDEANSSFPSQNATQINGNVLPDTAAEDVQMQEDEATPTKLDDPISHNNELEPSFGDLLKAKDKQHISIAEAIPAEANTLVPTHAGTQVAAPSGISLSTVLSQALRTNDSKLLETCLLSTDTQIIRSTIQRMDSAYAGILMRKIAERLSNRPGRYGSLLTWVRWICVTHGGVIADQPDVLSDIKTLYTVLNQRSQALDTLLLLKGKLDMLDAQLDLRRQLLAERDRSVPAAEGHLIYVEGDEPVDDSDSEDEEEMPLPNGVLAESDASELDSEADEDLSQPDGHDLIVDEAESDEGVTDSSAENDNSSDENEAADTEDESSSEINDFIDDGPIVEVESGSELLQVDQSPQPPAKKKRRR